MRTSRRSKRTSRKPRRRVRRNPQIVGRFRMPNSDWLGRKSDQPTRDDFVSFLIDSASHSSERAADAVRLHNDHTAALNNLLATYRYLGEARAYLSLQEEPPRGSTRFLESQVDIVEDFVRNRVLPYFGIDD